MGRMKDLAIKEKNGYPIKNLKNLKMKIDNYGR